MNQTCPHCSSTDSTWKAKAGKWECNACEERFDGAAPDSASPSPSSDLLAPTPPSLSDKAATPKRIFFSYGHDANRELVDRFKSDLEKRGHTVWIDYKEIGTWSDWKGKITQGIHDSGMAIAFLSLHSTRDPGVCRNEIAMALHHFGVVYPVMVEQVPFESIPVTIAQLQWPDLTQWREIKQNADFDFERFYEEKLLEIVNRIEGEATRFASEIDVLRRVLRPSTFEGKFAQHLEGFVGREWVFKAYEEWLEHQPDSRVFWLKAGPGFGKSALAVNLANRYRGAVIGTWFCDSQSVELRDPLRAVMTIAFQLATRWDDYRTRLLPRLGLFEGSRQEQIDEAIQTLAKKNLDDLFTLLISEPLAGLIWREHKLVILMDALDEASDADGKNALTALISGRFLELPSWISFVATSRPDASVVGHLQRFKPFELSAEDNRNTDDLALYCRKEIGGLIVLDAISVEEREKLWTRLVEKAEGMILYLRMVAEGLKEKTLSVGDLDSMERGLGGLYSRYHQTFSSRFRDDFEETIQPLLRLVMAAPGPMPLDLAAEVLGWTKEKVRKVRAKIGSYLEGSPEGIRIFHKTLGEWLESEGGGEFFTNPDSGRKQIGEFLWECFEKREMLRIVITQKVNWESQVLGWLPIFLVKMEKWAQLESCQEFEKFLRERYRWDSSLILSKQVTILMRRIVSENQKTLGPNHIKTLKSLTQLAKQLPRTGNQVEKEKILKEVLEESIKTLGEGDAFSLRTLTELARVRAAMGDYEGAEKCYRDKLEITERIRDVDHDDIHSVYYEIGGFILAYRDYNEGKKYLIKALDVAEKIGGEDGHFSHNYRKALGRSLQENGDYLAAELIYRKTLELRIQKMGLEDKEVINLKCKIGDILRIQANYNDSIKIIREALETAERIFGIQDNISLFALKHLAKTQMNMGNIDEAIDLLKKRYVYSENCAKSLCYIIAVFEWVKGNKVESLKLLNEFLIYCPLLLLLKERIAEEELLAHSDRNEMLECLKSSINKNK
jgi:tetratricopeptide (TPR) repeat protein